MLDILVNLEWFLFQVSKRVVTEVPKLMDAEDNEAVKIVDDLRRAQGSDPQEHEVRWSIWWYTLALKTLALQQQVQEDANMEHGVRQLKWQYLTLV
jgi:hypothetical protein